MNILKIVTTALICIMMLIILWFCQGFTWKRDKANVIGFGFMEIVYILILICMWA